MKFNIGTIAFLIGFFGSILVGLLGAFGVFESGAMVSSILVISGIIIGLMNIEQKEKVPMMIASLVIGLGAGVLGSLAFVGEFIVAVLNSMAVVFVPAGMVIAVLVVMEKAR